MPVIKVCAAFFLIAFASGIPAAELDLFKETSYTPDQGNELQTDPDSVYALHLVAKEVTLKKTLVEISHFSGVEIHYSTLPDELITKDCKGSVQQLLTCLFGPGLNMALRNELIFPTNQKPVRKSEIWLLDIPKPFPESNAQSSSKQVGQIDTTLAEQKKADYIRLALEQLKDPKKRADAVASLAIAGNKEDLTIRLALKNALKDENPGIRAQAIFAITQREGEENALEDLQKAMHDNNVEVRRMVVERSTNWPLLQQALKDNDQSVRQYAETKLAVLNKAHEEN